MEPQTYLNSINIDTDRIEEILVDLGYELSDKGNYWQSNAVYRDGDNRTALQIWKDTGIWKDFVQGTSYQPFKKLIQLSCSNDERVSELLGSFSDKRNDFIPIMKSPKMEVDKFYRDEDVGTLLPHYKFYNQKFISDKTLRLYKCGFSMSGKMNGRFVFPIYQENGKIIGQTGRHLMWEKDKRFAKWKHLGRKTNWIYPLNIPTEEDIFLKCVEEKREIILVEGIGDSLALTEQGFLNHMVLFGVDISSKQLSYLMSLDVDKITISTNNDSDKSRNIGREAAIKIFLKLIKQFDVEKIQIKLPLLKDFGEMLENDVCISRWCDKKIRPIKQITTILQNRNLIKDKKCVKILEQYLERLSFEADTISQ